MTTMTTRYEAARGLRVLLKLDALASGGLGVVLATAGALLADPLGLPTALLVPAGLFLVPFAGWLWYLATRPAVSPTGVREVIAANLLWIVASVTLVAAGWFSPTALGAAFVLVQAAAVVCFVAGQYVGLRRLRPTVA